MATSWVREQGNILIDPVPMSAGDAAQLDALGGAALIVLTNRDHERDAVAFKERTGAQIVAHEADAPLFALAVDRTVADGEEIVPDLRVLHLAHGKSPGEIALLWRGGSVAFIGDLCLGPSRGIAGAWRGTGGGGPGAGGAATPQAAGDTAIRCAAAR